MLDFQQSSERSVDLNKVEENSMGPMEKKRHEFVNCMLLF